MENYWAIPDHKKRVLVKKKMTMHDKCSVTVHRQDHGVHCQVSQLLVTEWHAKIHQSKLGKRHTGQTTLVSSLLPTRAKFHLTQIQNLISEYKKEKKQEIRYNFVSSSSVLSK